MPQSQIALRMILAAPLAGALCALGFLSALLVIHYDEGVEGVVTTLGALLVLWLVYAAPIGVVAGLVLGAVPVVVGVLGWPALERRLGSDRAIEAVVLTVGATSFLESLFVAWAFEATPVEAVGWALGAAVISALTLRWMLRSGRRSHLRRVARHGATY